MRELTGDAKRVRLYGQETIWNTWAIANINMLLHGLDAQVKQGNTIKDPKFLEGGGIRPFDRVGANFPFSEENWWLNGTPKKDAKGKPVLKKNGSPQLEYPDKDEFSDPFDRFVYGIPPFSNGDFVFLQHIVASLNETGRAGVVCPQGVLFRGQPAKTEEEDGQNRKPDDEYLIRRGFLTGIRDKDGKLVGEDTRNLIEAIVVLPDNLFYGTTIPGSLVFFNKAKPADRTDKVLMVHAAREGWYKETPDQNVLLPHDVLRILIQLLAWGDIEVARRILPELRHVAPKLAGATYTAQDESGDANRFARELVEHCQADGVRFLMSHTVTALRAAAGKLEHVEATDSEGRFQFLHADAYVLAMGSWSPLYVRSLGVRLPIYPAKGYSVTMPVRDATRAFQVSLTDDEHKIVFSRLGDKLRIAGTAELNGYDRDLNRVRCEAIVQRTEELFPGAGDTQRAQFWTGLRPATPSNVPIIGRSKLPNLYLNTGHGTLGWTHACGSGKSIARIVSGQKPEVDFPFVGS